MRRNLPKPVKMIALQMFSAFDNLIVIIVIGCSRGIVENCGLFILVSGILIITVSPLAPLTDFFPDATHLPRLAVEFFLPDYQSIE